MDGRIEDENIDNLDETELRSWADDAIATIERLRHFESLVTALGNVIEKQAYADLEMNRAAHEFIKGAL